MGVFKYLVQLFRVHNVEEALRTAFGEIKPGTSPVAVPVVSIAVATAIAFAIVVTIAVVLSVYLGKVATVLVAMSCYCRGQQQCHQNADGFLHVFLFNTSKDNSPT
jgi:hypothetical protein